MTDDAIEIRDRETVYRGFFRVDRYRLRHRLFGGGWSEFMTREVFERGRTVGVLLYDPGRDTVVLTEQFRLPPHLAGWPGWQLEIVAGIVDRADDSLEDVARRETEEETGLALAGALAPMHCYMPSPGGSSEVIDLYCGRVDSSRAHGIHGLAAEHEDIRVVVLAWREALRRLRRDEIRNGPTVVALYWLAAHRARLRRRWPG